MDAIVSVIAVTSLILLIYALFMRGGRGTHSVALQGEARQRLEDENRRLANEPLLPSTDGNSRLTQPELDPKPKQNVTPSLTNAADRSRCPACGAIITANDESCPSCEIRFVADGSRKWKLGTVGPADAIYLPPTEVREE